MTYIVFDTNTGHILQTSSFVPEDFAADQIITVPESRVDTQLHYVDLQTRQLTRRENAEQIQNQRGHNLLRSRRNALLSSTDWTQLPDALSELQRQQWAQYRQNLRDLPAGWPAQLPAQYRATWPQKPAH